MLNAVPNITMRYNGDSKIYSTIESDTDIYAYHTHITHTHTGNLQLWQLLSKIHEEDKMSLYKRMSSVVNSPGRVTEAKMGRFY